MTLKRQIIFASAITLASVLAAHLDIAGGHRIDARHTKNDTAPPAAFEPVLIKTGAQF